MWFIRATDRLTLQFRRHQPSIISLSYSLFSITLCPLISTLLASSSSPNIPPITDYIIKNADTFKVRHWSASFPSCAYWLVLSDNCYWLLYPFRWRPARYRHSSDLVSNPSIPPHSSASSYLISCGLFGQCWRTRCSF